MNEQVVCKVDGRTFKGEVVPRKNRWGGWGVTVKVLPEDWPWELFPEFRERQNVITLASKYVTVVGESSRAPEGSTP